LVTLGVMCSSCAGALTLNGYSAILVALTISLPGRTNFFLDAHPVHRHGLSDVPTPKVHPLSTTVEGMVPFSMPRRSRSSSSPMTYCREVGALSLMFAILSCFFTVLLCA
jgi:hypothetical protein